MGLFDFLKPKPDQAGQSDPAAKPAANPAADAGNDPAAAPPKTGPRYQGANFVAPVEPLAPPPPPFEPENVLEQLLLLAPADEAARPAFYQALLQEDILMVLAPGENGENQATGEVQLSEGQQIQLQVLQDGRLPIFTSAARLADGGMDASLVSYVRLPGHAFFSMTQGQDCVLNPFSPAGKLLPADEIAALLAGQLAPGGPEGLPADAQVTLSTPAELPTGLADALRTFGQGHATIRAIYLAQMQLAADSGQPPRLLLGFDTTDQNPDFLPELGPALEGRTGEFQHVDLMLVDLASDEGVNPYFRLPEVEPVYRGQ